MRVIRCCYCALPSVNQYGTSPFNQLGRAVKWPSIIMHEDCLDSFEDDIREMFPTEETHPLITQLRRIG